MKMRYFLLLFFALGIAVIHAQSVSAAFTQNLRLGDTGPEVALLQRELNKNQQTRLTTSGLGSPGNETTYFGQLTHSAVIRFQELYTQEILTPVGLSRGTGFVGPSTRAKLNSLAAQEQNTPIQNPDLPTAAPEGASDDLLLTFPSQYVGESASKLVINGMGFESSNTVYFGNHAIKNLPSQNGTQISLTVPDIEHAKYAISVENSKGRTKTDAFFIIKDKEVWDPMITSVYPRVLSYGEKVTVSGVDFLPEGNEIRTSYGIIAAVSSSDQKTLEFEVKPFPDSNMNFDSGTEWDISFYVINNNGISNRETFVLKF